MGMFREIKESLSNWREASQLGEAIGKEAYQRGIEELDWNTVERMAEENGVDLDYSRVTRDVVANHINDSYEQQKYEAEQQSLPWWKRGW